MKRCCAGSTPAFEKWRAKPSRARTQNVNAVAYCAQAVAAEAQALADGGSVKSARKDTPAPFPIEDVREYVERNVEVLCAKAGHPESAASLVALNIEELYGDLEQSGAAPERDRRKISRAPPVNGQ